MPRAIDAFMLSRYRDAGDADQTKFLREEVIEVAGAKVACFVVQVLQRRDRNLYTWWIDKGATESYARIMLAPVPYSLPSHSTKQFRTEFSISTTFRCEKT
jgi:hypothetical protein